MMRTGWWAVRVRIKGLEDEWDWSRNEVGGPALFPSRRSARIDARGAQCPGMEVRVVFVHLAEMPDVR